MSDSPHQRTILKWPLMPPETVIPGGHDVIHVADQHHVPTVWTVATGRKEAGQRLIAVPTGGEAPADAKYLGTTVGQSLVWHIFRVGFEFQSSGSDPSVPLEAK